MAIDAFLRTRAVNCLLTGGLLATLAGACDGSGDDGSVGDSGSEGRPTTDTGSAGSTEPGSESSDGGLDTGTSSDSGGPPLPTTTGGEPSLIIEESPSHDFGGVQLGELGAHQFTVTNEGDGDALDVVQARLRPPFQWTGAKPGDDTMCGATIGAGESCTFNVVFGPAVLGAHAGGMSIAYAGGREASCALVGEGTGTSANLLVNGGGEMPGEPPPGWQAQVGDWVAGTAGAQNVSALRGGSYIAATSGPWDIPFSLQQEVAVDHWADLIDAGAMTWTFEGWARSANPFDDEYRVWVRSLDANGDNMMAWNSGWLHSAEWAILAEIQVPPLGTRIVQVELQCRFTTGSECRAYFDDLQLQAQYDG